MSSAAQRRATRKGSENTPTRNFNVRSVGGGFEVAPHQITFLTGFCVTSLLPTAPQSAFGAGYARPLECLLSYGSYQQNVSSRTMDSHLAVGTARPRELLRFSREDVFQHRTREDCWIILYGEVYNVTAWLSKHPGGAQIC